MSFLTFTANIKVDLNGWTETNATYLCSAHITNEGKLIFIEGSEILEGNASY